MMYRQTFHDLCGVGENIQPFFLFVCFVCFFLFFCFFVLLVLLWIPCQRHKSRPEQCHSQISDRRGANPVLCHMWTLVLHRGVLHIHRSRLLFLACKSAWISVRVYLRVHVCVCVYVCLCDWFDTAQTILLSRDPFRSPECQCVFYDDVYSSYEYYRWTYSSSLLPPPPTHPLRILVSKHTSCLFFALYQIFGRFLLPVFFSLSCKSNLCTPESPVFQVDSPFPLLRNGKINSSLQNYTDFDWLPTTNIVQLDAILYTNQSKRW